MARGIRLARLIATCGSLGERLPAPGTTVGSPAAIAGWVLLTATLGELPARLAVEIAVLAALTVAGTWAAGAEARRRGTTDPSPVVVDEVAGQWMALIVTRWAAGEPSPGETILAATAFLAFRVLDITKPWPIRRLESLPGGLGIMADDLAAGLLAGLLTGGAWRLLAP